MKRHETKTWIEEIDGSYCQVRYYRYTGNRWEPLVSIRLWIELGASL